jgi:hypothetical protein
MSSAGCVVPIRARTFDFFLEFSFGDSERLEQKFKHRQYKQTLINQLDSLHVNNPKLYWNLINDLRQQKEKDQRGSAVDPPMLYEYV